ncbi:unnamed protein product [Mycena citricolor]|uniref:Chromo domain-containing protein n=1 Tax=Mycena citricolor TaxID=2018698 RepID=A0AAD2HNV1_9AGAR|nr:unnamed protein product [Mycena citricolor]
MTTTVSQFSHPHSHTLLLKPNTSITHQTHHLIITPSTCHSPKEGQTVWHSAFSNNAFPLGPIPEHLLKVYKDNKWYQSMARSSIGQNPDGSWDVKEIIAMKIKAEQVYFYVHWANDDKTWIHVDDFKSYLPPLAFWYGMVEPLERLGPH